MSTRLRLDRSPQPRGYALKSTDDEANPWHIEAADLVYDNPWISVTHHRVLTPQNHPGVYGTVHFKHLAVGILPIDAEGYTFLVGQYRFPLRAYQWEIPEGGGDPAIDPLVSAQRELQEETGIVATHWRRCLEMRLSNSVTDEKSVSYIASGLSHGEATPDPTEKLKIKRVHFQEAVDMVLEGEITDAISVATILHAHLIFGREGMPKP